MDKKQLFQYDNLTNDLDNTDYNQSLQFIPPETAKRIITNSENNKQNSKKEIKSESQEEPPKVMIGQPNQSIEENMDNSVSKRQNKLNDNRFS
jgi:hypothetical protein